MVHISVGGLVCFQPHNQRWEFIKENKKVRKQEKKKKNKKSTKKKRKSFPFVLITFLVEFLNDVYNKIIPLKCAAHTPMYVHMYMYKNVDRNIIKMYKSEPGAWQGLSFDIL